MPISDRLKSALMIMQKAIAVSRKDIETIGMVVYAMADKFLEESDREKLLEEMCTMELSKMFIMIAEKIGLPLETVLKLKKEAYAEK